MANSKKISGYSAPEEVVEVEHKAFDYSNAEELLKVKHLKQYFRFGRGAYKYTKAVHDVSFNVYKGEVFGLVGESGCGKTTTGRSIIKLYKITSGDVWFKGVRIAAGTRWNEKEIKFTRIRLTQKLAEIKVLEKNEIADLPDGPEKDQEIAAIRAKYDAQRDEAISFATGIINTERERIKLAKHDNAHCNDDIAKKAVQAVDEKYDAIIAANGSLTDEEKAAYKKERAAAKKENITSKIQMIFQDPIASLNPRMTVRNIIAEGLVIRGVKDQEFITKEVNRVLELVGLLPEHSNRYPHEFSGGQRQRIGIARAIVMNPELIIADEPVSALDVSIQAQVINLLNDLRNDLGLTILFIAHNLSVVKYFCDRIAVMYYGSIMELTTSDELFAHPLHPYTKSLLSAVPHPDPNVEQGRTRIRYNPHTAHDYSEQKPTLRELKPGHWVSCNDAEAAEYLKELGE